MFLKYGNVIKIKNLHYKKNVKEKNYKKFLNIRCISTHSIV